MSLQKPEGTSIAEILKLVSLLSPDEQDELMEEMKLRWLRREIKKGVDQADRGELLDGDTVFTELRERYQSQSEQK